MQFIIRSAESSSIGTVTNFDWPIRIVEVIISIDSARRALSAGISVDLSAKRKTSLVSAAARTDPVKKSPLSRSAIVATKRFCRAYNQQTLRGGVQT